MPAPTTSLPEKPFFPGWKPAALLGIISFSLYANTLRNGFVLDDVSVITNNAYVSKGLSAIPGILSTTYHHGFLPQIDNLYRPLSLILFAAETQFFGLNPALFHLVTVLLYACSVMILFLSLDKLFENRNAPLSFLAALLFSLHPLHTEVVANIKSCDELLYFFFGFLSLNIFIRYLRFGKPFHLLLATGCYFLSLLAKETAIDFIFIIPLVFYFHYPPDRKRAVSITVSSLAAVAVFLIIRQTVLQENNHGFSLIVDYIDNILTSPDIPYNSRLATAILILGRYLKLLVIPHPLVADYSYAVIQETSFSNFWVIISLAIVLALLFIAIYRLINFKKDKLAFGLLCLLIPLLTISNIFFLLGTHMAERLLFLPSVGFCLLAGLLILKVTGKASGTFSTAFRSPGLVGIILPVAVIYAAISFQRNMEWKDDFTLFSADVKKSPASAKLNRYVGLELEKRAAEETDANTKKQLRGQAISCLNTAVTIYPDFYQAHEELGALCLRNGQLDEAAAHELRALHLYPGDTFAIKTLAKIYFKKQQFEESLNYNRLALQIEKDKAGVYIRIGACFAGMQNYDSSIWYFSRAAQLDPADNTACMNLALIYKALNKPDSVAKYQQLARQATK